VDDTPVTPARTPPAAPPRSTPLGPGGAQAALAHALVLDARDEAAFAAGHLPGAGRIGRSEFRPRRAELPPRTSEVLVVHDDPAEARATAEALIGLGYRHVAWLDVPLADMPDGRGSRAQAERIWRPSPFLAGVLDRLPRGRALDLASGSGREAVFLALHGWDVEAWDHAPDALERAQALASRSGVRITTRVAELERGGPPPPERPWDVITVFRFLHRPLFAWIERALAPGGALVYETFRVGQEMHGRPRQARFLLGHGELASAFPSLRAELLEDSEPAGGPVMSRLLARRPADVRGPA